MSHNEDDLVYVACAFGENDPTIRELRIDLASCFCAEKMREGIVVFCPLIHNYYILKHGLPVGWDYWERFNSKLLKRADKLFVLKLKGWEKSVGIQAEIALARKYSIPIEYHEFNAPERHLTQNSLN